MAESSKDASTDGDYIIDKRVPTFILRGLHGHTAPVKFLDTDRVTTLYYDFKEGLGSAHRVKGDDYMLAGLRLRKALAVFLAGMLLRPYSLPASPAPAIIGSVTAYGAVNIGDIAAAAETPLFAGDLIHTEDGNAAVRYKQGTRAVLDKDSIVRFDASTINLQEGKMSFNIPSPSGPVFYASTLRFEPAMADTSANVKLENGKASISVTQGTIRAVDPTGVVLSEITAGESRLFAMASPAAAAPAAPATSAVAPPVLAPTTIWLLVLGGAAFVATTAAIIANDNTPPKAISPNIP